MKIVDEKQQFLGLEPLDQTADRHGAFPCGGIAEAVETKAFKIPETLSSNEYTIQMSWTNADGTFYSCADVKVVKGADCKTPADASGSKV